MGHCGMAKHSESSFNEASAVRMLSDLLESSHTIKTFFKENDRTPNYDGFFELVGYDGDPKKQFIVQIKKTKALRCEQSGKHKGKYIYDLETSFLYYVKAKVAESPAVYFVVDIDNSRVFYLYLSDETLMGLNFEGHQTVRYPFDESNVLVDVNSFYKELDEIAIERNKKFLYKTEAEIAEMQEAVEYLNTLLDSDLIKIKEYVFPGLWRFGIGLTQSNQFEITHYSRELKQETVYRPDETNMFCLYPQYKGKLDLPVGEFKCDGYYRRFDCIGKLTPMEYVKDNLGNMIKDFCQSPPHELLPTIVLEELTFIQAIQIHQYFADDNKLIPSECLSEVVMLFRYLEHLIFDELENEKECTFKSQILKHMRRISLFDSFAWNSIILELRDFRTKHKNDEDFKLHTNAIFRLIGKEGVEYFVAISELTKRSISSITSVWKYNPTDYLQKRSFLERDFKPICEKWFGHLPSLYQEFYDNVFNGNMKYLFSREIEYCIEDNMDRILSVVSKARVYSYGNKGLNITYQKPLSMTYSEADNLRGLLYIQSGELFGASLMNRIPTLFYDGIRCFLYQGICDTLNLKCKGIRINGQSECLFK